MTSKQPLMSPSMTKRTGEGPCVRRMQLFLHRCKRIVGAPPTPEPERGWIEVRLEDGFQDEFQGHLHQSVFERWDAERPELTRSARLRNKPLADELGPVVSAAQFLPDFREELFCPTRPLFDLTPRDPVRAGRSASRVAGEPLPSMAESAAITHQIEQVRESSYRESASLHLYSLRCMSRTNAVFTAPGLIGPPPAGLLYPLSPFAMLAAFPPSDYYGDSAPCDNVHRSSRSSPA